MAAIVSDGKRLCAVRYNGPSTARKEKEMTNGRVFSAAALLLPILIARAADPPEVQEGLWEIHSQSIENPGNKKTEFTHKLCRDHAYDKAAIDLVKNMKDCTTNITNDGANKFTADSRCTVAGTAIVSKGIATYQGTTSAHSETRTTYTPALYGKTDEVMIQDQKYVGSCPAGMKPGDQMGADGTVQHRAK
jgi:hypothetical protein